MEEFSLNNINHSSDESKLRQIFPEELWHEIFKKIKDSDTYYRIEAASPYFHQVLQPLRTQILFPEVIKLCIDSMSLTADWYFSLYKCRAVCKAWNQAVETTYHQIFSETGASAKDWKQFSSPTQVLNENQNNVITYFYYHGDGQNKLDELLEFFHKSHFLTGRNPFPLRSLAIDIRPDLSIRNKLFDVLQIYGHHIWHCYVELHFRGSEEHQQVVLIVRKLLSLLTHLHTLRISTDYGRDNSEYLEPILIANPMPKLKNLKFLSCNQTAEQVVSELILKNPHIKGLRVSHADIGDPSALLTTPSLNLEEFHVLGFTDAENFSQLKTVQVQRQLTKLTFGFDRNYPDDSVDNTPVEINHVFNWIEAQWSESLTELNLTIPTPSVSEIGPLPKLPKLTTLRIKVGRYVCLDFILPLSKSLVHLNVYHCNQENEDEEYSNSLEKDSKIQFFLHMKDLRKSNIWKFFPRLRDIKYADDSVRGLGRGRAYRRNHWVGFRLE